MAGEKSQMSREKENKSPAHPPEFYVGPIRPELEQAFEVGDPFQVLYSGIQRVTGDDRAPYRAFSIYRIEKQPVDVSRRVSAGAHRDGCHCW